MAAMPSATPSARRVVNASPKIHGAASALKATPPPRTMIPVDATGPPRRSAAKRRTLANENRETGRPREEQPRARRRNPVAPDAEREAHGDARRGGRLEDESAESILDAPCCGAYEEVVHRDGRCATHRRRDPRGHAHGHTTPSSQSALVAPLMAPRCASYVSEKAWRPSPRATKKK